MAAHWYALQAYPRKEELVAHQLEAHEMAIFYPRVRVQPVNPRSRTVKPFFPGYLFVHVNLQESGLSLFRHLPHAIGIVCVGATPAEVPEDLLEAVHAHLEQINSAGGELLYMLQAGDPVVIAHGPFAGYEAIFDQRLGDSERVRVLLEVLGNRRTVLELSAGQLRASAR
jgi:transcriptional antiterminator RfaH